MSARVAAVLDSPGVECELGEAQRELRDASRAYVREVVVPARERLDAVESGDDFPYEVVEPGCALGLRLLPLPEELGGRSADACTLALVAEELAAGDLGVAYYFKHNWRFARQLARLPQRLRETIVRRLREDPRFLPASAMTEEHAGSDNNLPYDSPEAGLALRAERDGDEWVLDGSKLMITNGGVAAVYFVGARTDPRAGVSHGVTLFAVPADTPGVSAGPPYRKLGQRSSIQADVHFANVRIPAENAMSEVDAGLGVSHRALVGANVVNAAMAVGIARAAYEEALRWCTTRVQGGAPIYRHQLVAHSLGTMRIDIDAARSHVWQTARAFALHGADASTELVSGANVFATQMASRVTRAAMELFGGRGMMGGWPVEKLMRDAHTLQHANGTNPLLLFKLGIAEAEALAAAEREGQPRRSASSVITAS